jgi:hypothetical protein
MNKKSKKNPKSSNKDKPGLSANLFERDVFIYILLGITMLLVLIARLHLLPIPFERDEGEYAYVGKMILDGHPPYTLAYNMKLPGTFYMYALIMGIFGKTIVGVHLGLACITLASMLLVFLISGNFVSKTGSVISAATFGILGTSWTLLGQAAHATHFVIFFALIGIFILLQSYKSNKKKLMKYLIAGFFFSLAFICKQPGLFFALFGVTIIIVKEFRITPLNNLIKKLILFSLGFAVPVFIMMLYFYLFGDFDKFWFWTVKYLIKYNAQVPVSQAPSMFKMVVGSITFNYTAVGYTALWIISLVGLPFIFLKKNTGQNRIILFSFYLASFLTILPGLYFRNHYFITLLPVTGIMTAIFFDYFNDFFIQKLKMPNLAFITFFTFIFIAGTGVMANKEYLFNLNPTIACKQIYSANPFVESLEIAKFIEQNTTRNDKIAILGSEPQIYFYADRYSATGYMYTYSLVELHPYALSMQKEMIKEIERSKPKYILFFRMNISWLARTGSERFIFKWAQEYINKNYTRVGLLEFYPNQISSLKVRDQLINYTPQSQDLIYIYEKNK